MPRLLCLDGLRGVLAVYVMVSHMAPFVPMPAILASALSHGGAGVDAFFVLSGLVIVQSLRAHGHRRGPFLAARARRIFPVFLPVFAAAVAVQALDARAGGGPWGASVWSAMPWIAPDSPARDIWSAGWPRDWALSVAAHLTMTHGLFPNVAAPGLWVGFLGAAWSLSTEWQFYALIALAAPWLTRGRWGLPGLAALLLALAAAGLAWRLAGPAGWQFSRAFLPNKSAYFALGVASAAAPFSRRSNELSDGATHLTPALSPRKRGRRGGIPSGLGVFAATFLAVLLLCGMNGADKLAVPVLWLVVLAAQAAPGVAGVGGVARLLAHPMLLWLGAVSYPLYLVNEPVQRLLGDALAAAVPGRTGAFAVLWVPGALLLPVGLAWALHVGIERPAMRRRPAPGGVAAGGPERLCARPQWISPTPSPTLRTPMSRSRTG